MSDWENRSEEASGVEDEAEKRAASHPSGEGVHEINTAYVQDLLSRLRAEMRVISEEEENYEIENAEAEEAAVAEAPLTEEEAPSYEEEAAVAEAPLAEEEAPSYEEAAVAEEPLTEEEAPSYEEAAVAEAPLAEEEAPSSEVYVSQPQSTMGIFEIASVASEAAAAERKAKRRRFSARLLYRKGERPDAMPRDVGDSASLFEDEAERTDGVGTMRPQDFFIADFRHDQAPGIGMNEEYVSRNQIETILCRYSAEKRQISLRFFLSLFLSVFVLVFENLPLFGVSVPALFGITPQIYALLDIGCLAAALLLAADVCREGIHGLFAWEFSGASFVVLSSATALVLSVFSLILGTAEEAPLAVLPATLAVTMELGFLRLRLSDEETSFLHLCESGDKLAAEILPSTYAKEESDALGRRLRNVLRVKKVGFVTGYFARTKQKRDDYRLHAVLSIASFLVLFLGTLLCAVLRPEAGASSVLSVASWLAIPLSLSLFFGARRIPFHKLVEVADAHGTAVLGEASAEEYAAVEAVSFEDVEAFHTRHVQVRRIKLYENSPLDELLYRMSSIFAVLGGPLDGVFRVSAAELGLSRDVTVEDTAKEGLTVTVDGAEVRIGRWGYYPQGFLEPYYDSEDTYKENAGNISILYVTVNGSVCAKLYIEYHASRRFERMVKHLQKNGVAALVRSFDPGIENNLLATAVHTTGLTIKAVRKKPSQLCDFAVARIDSGLVTGAGSRDLLYTFFLCQNYRKVTRLFRILKILAVPLSLAVCALLYALGTAPLFYSVYSAAVSLVWLLPVALISRFYFQKEK